MRRFFCWLDLHLWRNNFLMNRIECELCPHVVTAESFWRRTGRNLWADRSAV